MSPLIAFEPMRLIPYAFYGLAAVLTLAVLPKLSGKRCHCHGNAENGEGSLSPAGALAGQRILVVDNEGAHQAVMLPAGAHVCCRLDTLQNCTGDIHVTPAPNFVSQRIDDHSASYCDDEQLKSVDRVMADSYAPTLQSSAVMPLDQRKAPSVTQRFADLRTLITHTIDPLLGEYFRDFEM